MRRTSSNEPTLITSVQRSSDDDYDRRRKRYALMMGSRALCVLGAALTYRFSLWLAMAFVLAGLVLPWCAVLIANDGPPKKRRAPRIVAPINIERALPPGSDRVVDG